MFDLESYHKARTVAEAIRLLTENPAAVPLAGGTDILVRLRRGRHGCRHLVDIHDVAELAGIVMGPDGTLTVGSGVTFTRLTTDRTVADHIPVLAEGAAAVGGPQIRNMATLGGNICNGAPCADSAAPLLVLNATVILEGPRGRRQVPLHRFHQGPGVVDRQPAEVVTGFVMAPDDYRCWSAAYIKYAMREAMDIATIGCAAACRLSAGKVTGIRLAFTVAGPTPLRCWKTEEKAMGAAADACLPARVRSWVLEDLRPRDSWRAAREFREHVIQVLTERVLTRALNPCG